MVAIWCLMSATKVPCPRFLHTWNSTLSDSFVPGNLLGGWQRWGEDWLIYIFSWKEVLSLNLVVTYVRIWEELGKNLRDPEAALERDTNYVYKRNKNENLPSFFCWRGASLYSECSVQTQQHWHHLVTC